MWARARLLTLRANACDACRSIATITVQMTAITGPGSHAAGYLCCRVQARPRRLAELLVGGNRLLRPLSYHPRPVEDLVANQIVLPGS